MLIGSRLGPYEVLAKLGEGGMGEVYRARDLNLHREVAIKLLQPLHVGDPDRLARFEREARLLASLSHPNIATIHGLERADGSTFLIMELASGETLAQRLTRGPIALSDAQAIALQIAAALERGALQRGPQLV